MRKYLYSVLKNPFFLISLLLTVLVILIAVLGFCINAERLSRANILDAEGYELFSKNLSDEYFSNIKARFVNQRGESYEDYRMVEGIGISFYGDGGVVDESTGGYTVPALVGLNFLERYMYIMGNPGETPEGIAARQGGVPMYAAPFKFDKGASSVQIYLENQLGDPVVPVLENNGGLNPCTIGGIEGEISVDEEGRIFFTRSSDEDEVGELEAISVDTSMVVTRAMQYRQNDIIVVFLKELPQNYNIDKYIDILRKMEEFQKVEGDEKAFYVIGPYKDLDAESAAQVENALSEAFGSYFINAREYLCTDAIEDLGMVLRREEYYDEIAEGKVCGAFLNRNGTLNIYGNYGIANLLTDRIKQNNPNLLEVRINHEGTN